MPRIKFFSGCATRGKYHILEKLFLINNEVDKFLILYKKVVLKQKYPYLLIDFKKNSEDVLAFRSLVANENYENLSVL